MQEVDRLNILLHRTNRQALSVCQFTPWIVKGTWERRQEKIIKEAKREHNMIVCLKVDSNHRQRGPIYALENCSFIFYLRLIKNYMRWCQRLRAMCLNDLTAHIQN